MVLSGTIALVIASASNGAAATPAQKCEAGKNGAAGKYAACLHRAQQKFVSGGEVDIARYNDALLGCDAKYATKWQDLEAKAGPTVCPSEGDESAIQDFLDACVFSAEDALGGGALLSDVATCNTDLGLCNGDLADCGVDVASTNADLAGCNGSLGTCNADLGTCTGDLGTCNSDLTDCGVDLSSTNADLAGCNGTLGSCSVNLGSCTNDLSACNGDLTDCGVDLSSTNADLAGCNGSLGTCNASLGACTSDLATCNAGTAAPNGVLSGQTFSSAAGIGVAGTMPNNGAVALTPGTTDQAIAAGYHNGTGVCSGDVDLAAAKIAIGVELFGVVGTVPPAQALRTGQTLCYNPAGAPIACAGTGLDGVFLKGIAQGYTDNGNGTITDNKTGLMWEKLSDDSTIHDRDNSYHLANAISSKIATLNSDSFAGYNDWRMPNLKELQTLQNFATSGPAVFSAFNSNCTGGCTILTCSCTRSSRYWSSTSYQQLPNNAWYVDFNVGDTAYSDKVSSYWIRAVRAGV